MFVKFIILLSSALFVSGALTGFKSKPMLDGRIVGGYPIDISQVPWQVSLQRFGSHFCGASIIGQKWILTAGHCARYVHEKQAKLWLKLKFELHRAVSDASSVTVRVGSTNKSNGGSLHKVKRIIENENYNPYSIDYDFALLELQDNIQFNENAQPIKLVEREQKIADDTICLVTGWGNTQSSAESSAKLRGAEIPIVNQQKCIQAYRNTNGITPRMMCAGLLGKGGKDSCQGDSGGPLVLFDDASGSATLVGVVSWGYGCAQPSYPGVYARLTEGRQWIYNHTGI